MRRWVISLLFILSVLFFPVLLKRATAGFKLAKMRLEMPFRPDWERNACLKDQELQEILSQRFFYLDKGAQCYVFESEDGKYVVKLFRYDQPQFIVKKKKSPRDEKIEKLFSACVLAFDRAKEETGLVHIHLNLSEHKLPVLRAKGPIGQTLLLPLDGFRFAIQKKAEPFRRSLAASYAASDQEAMQRKIDSFLAVIEARTLKGIGNSDPTVSRNFGFFGERAVEIDFGNYYVREGGARDEMRKHILRLRRWLETNAPEWVAYLDEKTP